MILLNTPIDLKEAVMQSIKNRRSDQSQAINRSDQKHTSDIASDGSFLELDENGTVKLFEAKVTDITGAKSPTTPIKQQLTSQEVHEPTEASQEPISDPICDASPTHGSYQRPDITLYDRLQIATCFWDSERPWGTVTWLAQKYGTSTQSSVI